MDENILKDAISNHYREIEETAGRIGQIEAAAKAVELDEVLEGLDGYVSLNTYGKPGITVTLYRREANQLAIVAQRLKPGVGRLEKGFDDKANELTLTTEVQGVTIKFSMDTPRTCTVEAIEEEVEIPEQITPAHTEKRVRYVLKGDCDPLMKPLEQAEPVPVPVGDEDISF